ncbi:MAG TPA: TlpA disulfide reductase family protein [Candidatus Limnocylindrales bacterium]|nr:TlpA disulfide reductase family protein [Candidatus Limnocylindrales bacterium]
MKRSVILVVFVVIVVTAFLVGGKLLSRGGKASSVSAAIFTPASEGPAKGALAPDFTLKTLDGKTVQLSSLKGKGVLVNFWATWCEPCKIEMPWLVDLQKKYGPQGLQIVGVAMDDSGEKSIADFARKMNVNYTVAVGNEKVADQYGGVDGLPTSFFVDRSGKVVDKAMGLVSESVIEDAIKKSLEQGGMAASGQ